MRSPLKSMALTSMRLKSDPLWIKQRVQIPHYLLRCLLSRLNLEARDKTQTAYSRAKHQDTSFKGNLRAGRSGEESSVILLSLSFLQTQTTWWALKLGITVPLWPDCVPKSQVHMLHVPWECSGIGIRSSPFSLAHKRIMATVLPIRQVQLMILSVDGPPTSPWSFRGVTKELCLSIEHAIVAGPCAAGAKENKILWTFSMPFCTHKRAATI